jgi:hypothetical protein
MRRDLDRIVLMVQVNNRDTLSRPHYYTIIGYVLQHPARSRGRFGSRIITLVVGEATTRITAPSENRHFWKICPLESVTRESTATHGRAIGARPPTENTPIASS